MARRYPLWLHFRRRDTCASCPRPDSDRIAPSASAKGNACIWQARCPQLCPLCPPVYRRLCQSSFGTIGPSSRSLKSIRSRCRRGWYNSVIAGDFLVQNLETRIHMFLGRLETDHNIGNPCGKCWSEIGTDAPEAGRLFGAAAKQPPFKLVLSVDFHVRHNHGQHPLMSINSRYPVWHKLTPSGGSGEGAGSYLKQGHRLSPTPIGEGTTRVRNSLSHLGSSLLLRTFACTPRPLQGQALDSCFDS
jgi:hypothetical protein